MTSELEKTKMMLAAYQKAFNQIEDVMEYHGLTDEYFYSIVERLMGSLRQIRDK